MFFLEKKKVCFKTDFHVAQAGLELPSQHAWFWCTKGGIRGSVRAGQAFYQPSYVPNPWLTMAVRAGETAQWLGAHTALLKDQSSIPNTLVR